jgi:RND family efflux transporter MFP subunit
MKQNRTVWWVALAVILALGAWWFFGKKTSEVKVEPVKTSHIATLKVAAGAHANQISFDGVVESVRQSVIAAQVAGNIVEIRVRAGDRVSAGQLLLRIDGMAAEQAAAAARNEYARQEALYRKNYISKAALEQAKVQLAAATAQSGYFLIKAPFSGVVTEVNAKLGEMALPGVPLMQIFDPSVMRVSAQVSQTQLAHMNKSMTARVELAGMTEENQWLVPATMEILPAVDARTHSGTIRLPLKQTNIDLVPGAFARVWVDLPISMDGGNAMNAVSVWIPSASVLRRGELNVVYVKSPEGVWLMRQVRLGQTQGDQVQVLSGLAANEEIAVEPQVAAAATAGAEPAATK